jgi:adenosylcobalamin-dependent ribonucleoside-triphosphate reductase
MLRQAREAAVNGANSMADELGLQRPRRVTQCQPAGTSSKALGLEGDEVHEGAHLAMSRWIFNNINFSIFDPIIAILESAGYKVRPNPIDPTGVLVTFPVEYPASPLFTPEKRIVDGKVHHLEINRESAISQLERYRVLMNNYIDHNCSITVSFDEDEIEDIADWFMEHWDEYVGVSFLKRNDPTRTAEDLGFKYLPQEAVSRETYEAYVATLRPVNLSSDKSEEMIDVGGCGVGNGNACPVR